MRASPWCSRGYNALWFGTAYHVEMQFHIQDHKKDWNYIRWFMTSRLCVVDESSRRTLD